MRKILILSAALATAPFGVALAQDSGAAAGAHAGHTMASDVTVPAACEAAAPDMEMPAATSGMASGMAGGENQGPVQMGNMAAMEAMHGPMMRAAMIEDADLAFNCGMIAHHQGAIAMAEVELEHGTDAESRALAEKIIADQQREIEQMTAWIEANAEAK